MTNTVSNPQSKMELLALAERVEKAKKPSRGLDAKVAARFGTEHGRKSGWCNSDNGDYFVIDECAARYTSSLDAAMTLVPEGRSWSVIDRRTQPDMRPNAQCWTSGYRSTVHGDAATPALALVAACLRSIAAMEGE